MKRRASGSTARRKYSLFCEESSVFKFIEDAFVTDAATRAEGDRWEGNEGDRSEAVIVAEKNRRSLPLLVCVLDVLGADDKTGDQNQDPDVPGQSGRIQSGELGEERQT